MAADDSHLLVADLARSHGGKLRQFLARRARNATDVPDLVQEVFLRMLRVGDPAALRSPEAYLFTVALHVAQQHAVKESAAPVSMEAIELFTQLNASISADPSLHVDAEQSLSRALRAIEQLSPKARATFVLHRHYGLSLKEIARELNISFPMAKKYLVKALIQFQKNFGVDQGERP